MYRRGQRPGIFAVPRRPRPPPGAHAVTVRQMVPSSTFPCLPARHEYCSIRDMVRRQADRAAFQAPGSREREQAGRRPPGPKPRTPGTPMTPSMRTGYDYRPVSFDAARRQLKRIYRTSDEAPCDPMPTVDGSPPGSQPNIVIRPSMAISAHSVTLGAATCADGAPAFCVGEFPPPPSGRQRGRG